MDADEIIQSDNLQIPQIGIVSAREIAALGCKIAGDPLWWWCNFRHHMLQGRLSDKEIAKLCGTNPSTLRSKLNDVRLNPDEIYNLIPKDL